MNQQDDEPREGELISRDAPIPEPRSGKSAALHVDLGQQITNTTTVIVNVAQEVHVTTRDKIELALRKVLPSYLDASSVVGPLGIFLALFVGLVTADFRMFMGVGEDVWKALFIISSLISFVYTIRNLWRYKNRAKLEDVVDAIVAESKEP